MNKKTNFKKMLLVVVAMMSMMLFAGADTFVQKEQLLELTIVDCGDEQFLGVTQSGQRIIVRMSNETKTMCPLQSNKKVVVSFNGIMMLSEPGQIFAQSIKSCD